MDTQKPKDTILAKKQSSSNYYSVMSCGLNFVITLINKVSFEMSSLLIPTNMMKLDEQPVPCLMKQKFVAPSVEMRASEQYFDSVQILFTSKKEVLQEINKI